MSIFYRDDAITLHQGDSLEVLQSLPSESVNCCVTSPPYYGLRDYGTGTWEGGGADCDHKIPLGSTPLNANFNERWHGDGNSGQRKQETAKQQSYASVCARCGATRVDRQYGLEPTPAAYVETMRALFAEVRRVLAKDGTLWLNIGDSYVGSGSLGRNDAGRDFGSGNTGQGPGASPGKQGAFAVRHTLGPKNLLGIPWRVAFALQDDGWILRNAIVWAKPNAMPESVTDRLSTKHELIFLFSRSRKYWFDLDPIRDVVPDEERTGGTAGAYGTDGFGQSAHKGLGVVRYHEKGRNPGDVWEIPTTPFPGAHFAVFPPEIPRRAILAGCKPGGVVLDPFSGSGTTGLVAGQLGRKYVGIDLSETYLRDSLKTRLRQMSMVDELELEA